MQKEAYKKVRIKKEIKRLEVLKLFYKTSEEEKQYITQLIFKLRAEL